METSCEHNADPSRPQNNISIRLDILFLDHCESIVHSFLLALFLLPLQLQREMAASLAAKRCTLFSPVLNFVCQLCGCKLYCRAGGVQWVENSCQLWQAKDADESEA